MGLVAFANMLSSSMAQAAETTPSGSGGTTGVLQQAALQASRQTSDFPVHEWRLSHVDTFDPKPMLEKVQRPADAGRRDPHAAQDRQPDEIAVQIFSATAKPIPRSASCGRTWGGISENCASFDSMYADIPNHEPMHYADEHRGQRHRTAVHGFMDHLRAGHREPRICPAMWCWCPRSRSRSGVRCGVPHSCRPCTKALTSRTSGCEDEPFKAARR